jgi:DNA modification methylase
VGRGVNVLHQSIGERYALYNGDSSEVLQGIPDRSIDLSVFSPPFQSLFTYSASERDLGNAKDPAEFWDHFAFISRELVRVMRPGRNVCVHVAQIGSTKATHGVTGLFDFRGDTIRHFVAAGFTYHGDIVVDKDPQAQAIRTHSKALLFAQMDRDASWLRPALCDYIVVFRAPGDNAVPVEPEMSREEWIEWARPIWYGIRESDTLNAAVARANDDERHIAPLQLGTIERIVRLWTNRGETVLSPFAGIGSEGVVALDHGRRFVGIELKPEYYRVAAKHLREAGQSMTLGLVEQPA